MPVAKGLNKASPYFSQFVVSCVAAAYCGAPLLLAAPAIADLTVASTVSVAETSPDSGDQAAPVDADHHVTVYSHGKKARIVTDGGHSSIIDADSGNVYVLDDKAKTYYKESLKSWSGVPEAVLTQAVATQASSRIDVDTQLNFDKTDDNFGNWQTLSGLLSKKFLLTGWINVSPKRSSGMSSGHRRGGMGGGGWGSRGGISLPMGFQQDANGGLLHTVQYGGGYPGGGGQRGGGMGGIVRSTQVSGDVWLAKSVGFVQDKSNSVWAQAMVSSWGIGQLTGDLAGKIGKERGLPMFAQISFTWTARPYPASGENSGVSGDQTETSDPTTVMTSVHVTSISEAAVDQALFMVPASYSQVSPPASPPSLTAGERNGGA